MQAIHLKYSGQWTVVSGQRVLAIAGFAVMLLVAGCRQDM